MLGLASGVWSLLTLGYGGGGGGAESPPVSVTPLADASLSLLLILLNHWTGRTHCSILDKMRYYSLVVSQLMGVLASIAASSNAEDAVLNKVHEVWPN